MLLETEAHPPCPHFALVSITFAITKYRVMWRIRVDRAGANGLACDGFFSGTTAHDQTAPDCPHRRDSRKDYRANRCWPATTKSFSW